MPCHYLLSNGGSECKTECLSEHHWKGSVTYINGDSETIQCNFILYFDGLLTVYILFGGQYCKMKNERLLVSPPSDVQVN